MQHRPLRNTVRNIAVGHDVSKPLIHDVAVQDNGGQNAI